MNLSEYFNSPEFKELLKPFYDKVRSNPEIDSDKKYLDFKLGVQSVTGKALLYYQQFMFKKESSQLIEENFNTKVEKSIDLGRGQVTLIVEPKNDLYYRVLSEQCNCDIKNEFHLISYIKQLSVAKVHYDKFRSAIEQVEETGYGVVHPMLQ